MEDYFLLWLNMTITASWVIVAVLLLRLVLRPLPKRYLCLLWLVVLFRLLCPVSLESEFSLIPYHDQIQVQSFHNTPQIETSVDTVNQIANQTVNPLLERYFAAQPENHFYPWGLMASILLLAWKVGMIVLFTYTFISWELLRVRLKDTLREPDGGYTCNEISSPFVFGILRPKVYLPSGLSQEERRWILLHERSHIHRGDFILKPLFWCGVILHWLNPLVWVAWYYYTRDLELACDEQAVQKFSHAERQRYSNVLVSLAVQPQKLPCPLAFGATAIRQRVCYVLNYRRRAPWLIAGAVCAMIVLMLVLAVNPFQVYTLGEVRESIAQEYENIAYAEICWGSAVVTCTNPEEIAQIQKQLAALEVQKKGKDPRYEFMMMGYQPDSLTADNWIRFYDAAGVYLTGISIREICKEISPGRPAQENFGYLQVEHPEQLQQILQHYCSAERERLVDTTFLTDLTGDGVEEQIVINPDFAVQGHHLVMAVYEENGNILTKRVFERNHEVDYCVGLYQEDDSTYLLEGYPFIYLKQGSGRPTFVFTRFHKDGSSERKDFTPAWLSEQKQENGVQSMQSLRELFLQNEGHLQDTTLLYGMTDGVCWYPAKKQ